MEELLSQVLNTTEKIQLEPSDNTRIQQLDCTSPCQNVINTVGTIRVTAGTDNPSSVVFAEPLNIGDTFSVTTDPTYLTLTVTECDTPTTVNTPCGDIECMVSVSQVSASGSLPFYFELPARFWPCTGPTTDFNAYLNDAVRIENVLCYNCNGFLPSLCEDGLSQVNGTATLAAIRRDDVYVYLDFNIEIILPGC